MEISDKFIDKEGDYIEIYRSKARKSGANYFRAIGHGVLDVATLGGWELIGTPIEGAISNNRGYIVAKLYFDNNGDDMIKRIVIFDAGGEKKHDMNISQ